MYRLTKAGRDITGATWHPIPLHARRVDHVLSIGNAYLALCEMGRLAMFLVEPRQPFLLGDKEALYSPDAFFGWRGKPFLLEVQTERSALASRDWARKWEIAAAYFNSEEHQRAPWQIVPNMLVRPRIVVVTNQAPETVRAGSELPLIIVKDITALEGI